MKLVVLVSQFLTDVVTEESIVCFVFGEVQTQSFISVPDVVSKYVFLSARISSTLVFLAGKPCLLFLFSSYLCVILTPFHFHYGKRIGPTVDIDCLLRQDLRRQETGSS